MPCVFCYMNMCVIHGAAAIVVAPPVQPALVPAPIAPPLDPLHFNIARKIRPRVLQQALQVYETSRSKAIKLTSDLLQRMEDSRMKSSRSLNRGTAAAGKKVSPLFAGKMAFLEKSLQFAGGGSAANPALSAAASTAPAIDSRKQWLLADQRILEISKRVDDFDAADYKDLLFSLNEFLTKGAPMCGRIRGPQDSRGGGLLAPGRIGDELSRYCNWLDEMVADVCAGQRNPIVVAARAYTYLNSIHPFADGNGRVCAKIMDLILVVGGLLPACLSGIQISHISTEDVETSAVSTVSRSAALVTAGVHNAYCIACGAIPLTSEKLNTLATELLK